VREQVLHLLGPYERPDRVSAQVQFPGDLADGPAAVGKLVDLAVASARACLQYALRRQRLWGGLLDRRWIHRRRRGPAQATAVGRDVVLDVLTEVVPQMPPVGHMHRLRRAAVTAF
jgi:hypothetical protein